MLATSLVACVVFCGTFESSVPKLEIDGEIRSPSRSEASGNRFANICGVAVQVQTPNSLVESNEIVNVYRGIELSGLLHYQEGPPPYNVVIRGNRIARVNRGIKSSFMTLNHAPAVTTPTIPWRTSWDAAVENKSAD